MKIWIIKEKESKRIIPKQWVMGRASTIEDAQKNSKRVEQKNKRKNIKYCYEIGV